MRMCGGFWMRSGIDAPPRRQRVTMQVNVLPLYIDWHVDHDR